MFTSMYQGKLPPRDPHFDYAIAVWAFYYYDTERHDRTGPGRWSPYDPECWLPEDAAESNRYAREQYRAALASLDQGEVSAQTSEAAKQYAVRLTFAEQANWPSPDTLLPQRSQLR